MEYLKQQLLAVLAIDSPTGHTAAAAQYVLGQYRALGFSPVLTNKGGVLVCVNEGCPSGEGGLLLEAHLDTLGAMVAEIKPNGRLRLTPLGGLNANNTEAENAPPSPKAVTSKAVFWMTSSAWPFCWHMPRALPGVPKNRRAPFGTISLCLKRWATAAAPACRRASPRPSVSIWAA